MAKDKSKSNKSEKVDAKNEKAAEREFKYGVEDIAEELGIKPASVRVQLRNKGIEKAGKAYGWNSKSELKEVIEQIKAKADEDEDEAPAKKSKKKDKAEKPAKTDKKAKKAKTKKSKDDEDEDDD